MFVIQSTDRPSRFWKPPDGRRRVDAPRWVVIEDARFYPTASAARAQWINVEACSGRGSARIVRVDLSYVVEEGSP
jgi:hypothetical protein